MDPTELTAKDRNLPQILEVKDFIAMGLGTIVGTTIFTLPGLIAARHAGPAVALSFLMAAVVAGLVAFAYAEMASVLPFAGSAYSWINVLFGRGWGWLAGWALLAEYFIAVAFVGSGLSSQIHLILASLKTNLPSQLSHPMGTDGGFVDLIALLAIFLVGYIVSKGMSGAARIDVALVILKVAAIFIFVIVGAAHLDLSNYHPFIPAYKETAEGAFGGWQGITAGASGIFLSYIGFDSIAASSAEAKNPQKTMPRGILGSLFIAVILFMTVSLILVGVVNYTNFSTGPGAAAPMGWAMHSIGFGWLGNALEVIASFGMFTALIGMTLAGSRLLYSFGRDKMLPSWFGKLDQNGSPKHSIWFITTMAIIVGAFFPFEFLAQLISAGTLIAFVFVTLGMYTLRKREGVDLPLPGFKVPLYPLMPALGTIGSVIIILGLGNAAKIYIIIWMILGFLLYMFYGVKRQK